MKHTLRLLIGVLAFTVVGCAQPQGDDRLKEKADIEAGADQAKTDAKAKEMEARLARLQRFFQAIAGTYEGKLQPLGYPKTFTVRFTITSTIPVYEGERIRSLDEITYDLTNLGLNIEEVTSTKTSDGKDFSMGCNFSDLKPKIDNGFVLATSTNCPTSWTLSLGSSLYRRPGSVEQSRENVTRKVLDGELDYVDELNVQMRSVHKSSVETLTVKRIN